MSNHQKRLSAPNSWPVERKTDTFTVKAEGPHGDDGVPLVVLLRDVLGYVDSTKEAGYAVNTDGVLVNGESPGTPERPIGMFDILAFPARSEQYRVFPDEGGRLGLTPIDADAAGSKLGKVVDKTVVDGGRVQLNLHDGANLLVDDHEIAAGDSVVVDNDDGSIVAHFPYEEGALVTAVDGSHAGEIGELASIEVTPGSSPNTVRVDRVASSTQREGGEAAVDDGEFETIEEYVVVIDENFVEDEPTDGEADDSATDDVGETVDEAEDDEVTEDDEAAEDESDADAEVEPEADEDDDSETVEAEEAEDDDSEATEETEPEVDAEPDEAEAEEAEEDDSDAADAETESDEAEDTEVEAEADAADVEAADAEADGDESEAEADADEPAEDDEETEGGDD